ncbi:hypothetical protein ACFCYX_00915 [Streptomyces populi]|uniref:hypothetical protein n=1 Tax=Streptomyces populi TaxID=2058924 RepID=UPI0035DBFDE2
MHRYGGPPAADRVAARPGPGLLEPADAWLAELPEEFTGRRITPTTLSQAWSAGRPLFVEPPSDKQFPAAVYADGTGCRTKASGSAPTPRCWSRKRGSLPSAVVVDVGLGQDPDTGGERWAVVEANMPWSAHGYAADPTGSRRSFCEPPAHETWSPPAIAGPCAPCPPRPKRPTPEGRAAGHGNRTHPSLRGRDSAGHHSRSPAMRSSMPPGQCGLGSPS